MVAHTYHPRDGLKQEEHDSGQPGQKVKSYLQQPEQKGLKVQLKR
jgi:hypothetical protein